MGKRLGFYFLAVSLSFSFFSLEAATAPKPKPTPKPPKFSIKAFSLYNVSLKPAKLIEVLQNGETVDLAKLPSRKITIEVETTPASIAMVQFELNSSYTFLDKGKPYSLAGEINNAEPNAYPFTMGAYSLTATPMNAKKIAGTASTISFTIIDSSIPAPTPPPTPAPTPPPTPNPTPHAGLNFGININGLSYWDEDSLYADVSKLTAGWWADNTNLANSQIVPFAVSSDNYPLTDAQSLSFMVGYPNGIYKATWVHDTNTNVTLLPGYETPTVVSQTDTIVDATKGLHQTTLYFQIKQNDPIGIHVKRVDPNNSKIVLSDFHIIAPETDSSGNTTYDYGTFSSRFLKKVAPFSVIRLMDFFHTNDAETPAGQPLDCPAVNWTDRTLPQTFGRNSSVYGQPGRQGGTYEEAAELANVSQKDLWINIPDCATDDYILQMAKFFHANLNPRSRLYLEFSNEVWNSGFAQYHHVMTQARANPELTSPDDVTRALQQVGFQIVKIGNIFKTEFGNRASQIEPVLAGQVENVWTIQVGLDFIRAKYGDPKQYVAFLAGAPYVDVYGTDQAPVDTLSLQYWQSKQQYLKTKAAADQTAMQTSQKAVLDAIFKGLHDYNQTYETVWIPLAKALSDSVGIPFVAYEGGQSLTSAYSVIRNQTVIEDDGSVKTGQDVYYQFEPKHLAQSDPRMADVYRELLGIWSKSFGQNLYCHFSLASAGNNFGFWGLVESINDQHSVKWDTIMSLMNGN